MCFQWSLHHVLTGSGRRVDSLVMDKLPAHNLRPFTPKGKLKGDHHENALLITVNVDYEINRPQDVFRAILSTTD